MKKDSGYKHTINLPNTAFSMKANLPQKEPEILRRWEQDNIYSRMLELRKDAPLFILHDGPPYANGNIHIGHALNKILKDIIIKYKSLRGFRVPYVPGWDCHGLPVEHQLFKKIGKRKDEVEQVDFRRQAHDFALKFVDVQKNEFKRLGLFGEWENPYLTLSHEYEAAIVRSFGDMVGKGYIYKGCKPVNWCVACETALAEAEVEYEEHTSPSIYVKFPVADGSSLPLPADQRGKPVYIVIWTTTPWTIMGNVAAAVNPEFTYQLVPVGSEILLIEKGLTPRVMEKAGITGFRPAGEVSGRQLENLRYDHPFGLRQGKVVLADYVSAEDGTGIVHTAPGYGVDDFLTGQRYGLEVVMQVDNRGRFLAETPVVGGQKIKDAAGLVIDRLRESNLLLAVGEINHSYPHCWRCKKPIIFRATEQWFISVDKDDLRQRCLEAIPKVKWIPGAGQQRISSMIENRPDWCLSRQRLWGVPIPVFYCGKCREVILDPRVIEKVAETVQTEGTDSWFIRTAAELLPDGFVCPKCGAREEFEKESAILDVWFDSGVSHQAVLEQRGELSFPADLYLEGSDQHRGWFQASLITSMAVTRSAPFREVLTHGFVVDGSGKKMSKSRGNVIAPQQVIGKLGADVLRLCVAFSDYNDDVRMSDEILARVSESYRKIRNTLKFILGNLYDYDPEQNAIDYADMVEIDRWALSSLQELVRGVTSAYEEYTFHQAARRIYNFCISQMSSFYLDILKDRLYTFSPDSPRRRSGQTALYAILLGLVRMIAPILPFTAEEAYGFSPGAKGDIFLKDWPEYDSEQRDEKLEENWRNIREIRNQVLKELERARGEGLIGNSLQAVVNISFSPDDQALSGLLSQYESMFPEVFIVSGVSLSAGIDNVEAEVYNLTQFWGAKQQEVRIGIKIEPARGLKCVRCWNVSETVGENGEHPELCARCVKNIS